MTTYTKMSRITTLHESLNCRGPVLMSALLVMALLLSATATRTLAQEAAPPQDAPPAAEAPPRFGHAQSNQTERPTVAEWLAQAREAMAKEDYAQAARLFSIAQVFAEEVQDVEAGKVIPFYVALAHQLQAEGADNETQARNLRERAMVLYAGVLRTFPNSAAVYNNLALLHEASGNAATALQMAGYAVQLSGAGDPDADAYACLQQQLSATSGEQADEADAAACQPRLSQEPMPAPAS